jgi:hypothetical protein
MAIPNGCFNSKYIIFDNNHPSDNHSDDAGISLVGIENVR